MPNTGKPSPACHLCRKRRVRCDLTTPGCLRCTKIGKACPGYRKQDDFVFVNQNVTTYPLSRRTNRANSEVSTTRTSAPSNTSTWSACTSPSSRSGDFTQNLTGVLTDSIPEVITHASLTVSPSTQLALSPSIPEDWNCHYVPIVLHQFSSRTISDSNRSSFYGYLDFLPELYRSSSDESCLALATNTVAKAHLANVSREQRDREDHVKLLGRALKAINAALEDPLQRVKDETILAVWLLGVYEILVSSSAKSPIEAPHAFHMHANGIALLLGVRGPYQFSTQRGRKIFWMMNILIQTNSVATNNPCPIETLDWYNLIQSNISTPAEELLFRFSFYIYQLASLGSRLINFYRQLLPDLEILPSQFDSFVLEVDTLEADMCTSQILTSALDPSDLTSLHLRNTLRGALLKVLHYLLLLHSRLPSSISSAFSFSSPPRLPNHTPIQKMDPNPYPACISSYIPRIDSISGEIIDSLQFALATSSDSIPFTMRTREGGWADGLRVLFPLLTVSRMERGKREYLEEAYRALQKVGTQMGVLFALEGGPPSN